MYVKLVLMDILRVSRGFLQLYKENTKTLVRN
jgi:hypothetical protein